MKLLVSLTLFLLLATIAPAQKKNLTPDDYGKWQTLSFADVSANGEWVAYIVASREENDTLYVVNSLTNKTYKLEFATNFELSKDNRWIAWQIGVSYKNAEKLRDQKQPIRYKMGLLNPATGKKRRSYRMYPPSVFPAMVSSSPSASSHQKKTKTKAPYYS